MQKEKMIRDPQIKDIPQMTALTKEIYGEFMTKHGMELNDTNLKTTVEAFVKTKSCIVCERGGKVVGIAAWHLSPHPGNYSLKVFQEVLWAVKSKIHTDSLALLKALHRKAVELKADVVVFVNLSIENEPKVRSVYKRMGFTYLESHYCQAL